MTEIEYELDPRTGLPLLDEDYAFKVTQGSNGYQHNGTIFLNPTVVSYRVEIVKLAPKEFSDPKPVYQENKWGLFRWSTFVNYSEPIEKPRKELNNWMYEYCEDMIKIYTEETLPKEFWSDHLKITLAERKAFIKERYSKPFPEIQFVHILELNEENILAAAIEAFQGWEAGKAALLAEKKKREEAKALASKYIGLYPPKGINRV